MWNTGIILKKNQKKGSLTSEMKKENIALIGFMGAGKSAVSQYIQDRFGYEKAEIDQLIMQKEGMPITEIFAKHGEGYFRDCESREILRLGSRKKTVISCGGGAVIRKENVENLKKTSRIILLTASPETILKRVKHSTDRPILNGNMNVEYIGELMEKRQALYQAAADFEVITDGKTIAAVSREIMERISKME